MSWRFIEPISFVQEMRLILENRGIYVSTEYKETRSITDDYRQHASRVLFSDEDEYEVTMKFTIPKWLLRELETSRLQAAEPGR